MARVTYAGPSHTITIGDKTYKRGDVVDVTKELREALEKAHHRFEDVATAKEPKEPKEAKTEEKTTE